MEYPMVDYQDFAAKALRDETLAFAGEVVVVHGDSHWHRVDHPLLDPASRKPLANFTRIETYGSPRLGWVTLHIDASRPGAIRITAHPYPPGDAG